MRKKLHYPVYSFLFIVLLFYTGSHFIVPGYGEDISPRIDENGTSIEFFYNSFGDPDQEILLFLEEYAHSHPDTRIDFNTISGNQTNAEKFVKIRNKYPQESIHMPVVFIGDTFLQGESNILSNFNSTVELILTNSTYKGSPITRNQTAKSSSLNSISPKGPGIGQGVDPCGC